MMNKTMIKIICIIMAALMILSVGAVVLQVFAVDESTALAQTVTPDTGDSAADYIVPAGIAVAAVLAVIVCVALPRMRRNETTDEEE